MSVTIEWDNPQQTAIRWAFSGVWTWEEMNQVENTFRTLIDDAEQTVDIILDMTDSAFLPMKTVERLNEVISSVRHTRGIIFIVGANTMIQLMFRAYGGLSESLTYAYGFVDTIDEARDIIHVRD
jgi:hypothetical protein